MTKNSLLALLIFLGSCTACQPAISVTPPTATVPPPTLTVASPSATPTNTPTAHQASEPGLTGWLAFYSDRDGNPEIYIMNADGSGVARLTNDPAFDDSPALSPDGRQIAFLTARHDPNPKFPDLKYELYVMDVDGNNLRRLTTTEAAEDHPAWSPNGNRISFDADYDGDGYYEIYTIQPDGSNLIRLTSGAYNDQFADWAPDGKQIAFSSDRKGNWDLFVMDADGSNQRAITSSPNWELFPAWSPDGSRIAFNGLVPRSRNTDIFLVNADGSDLLQLTDSPGFDENPAWSPEGSQIAFQTQRSGNFELYVMNPDGSGQRPLAAHPADELWPSWALSTPILFEKSSQELGLCETFQAGRVDGAVALARPRLPAPGPAFPVAFRPAFSLPGAASDLRLLGLQKTEQAIAWLRRFLAQNSGKALIFAHHNDVVEELAAALDLPAIYGKVTDDDKRSAIAASFIHPDGPHALIVASDVELAWLLAPVTALVFVELWITPRQLYSFVDHILGQDETRTLPVHLLHVKDSLDDDALQRLGLRLSDYDLTMDGVQPKA